MSFNQAQLCAVRHKDGPMLVLAGPGSGKTTVIIGRINYLVREGTEPSQILVITFTKAAALEMQKRYEKELKSEPGNGPRNTLPVFGTFHSVFFEILRRQLGFTAKSLIKPKEQFAALRKILSRTDCGMIYTDDIAELLLSEIGKVKNMGGLNENYEPAACKKKLFSYIYQAYGEMLSNMRLLDFDDMLLLCRRLFSERPEVLMEERRKYRYILIDEFQDINPLQYEIVRLLAKPLDNLFIVGDDDQSIYGFRGARPELMLAFPKEYPQARTVLLGTNYRSGEAIVSAAGRLIAHNKTRFRKQLKAGRELSAFVREEVCGTETEERQVLAARIRSYERNGVPLSEIAVLYRTRAEAVGLRAFLTEQGIAAAETVRRADTADGTAQTAGPPLQKEAEPKNAANPLAAEQMNRRSALQAASNPALHQVPRESVTLATFHASKGLEFTAVFIIDASEGITPHRRSSQGEALEEERRMFYVAVTRAKQYLHILYTKARYNRTQTKSRFVTELLEAGNGRYGRIKGFGGRR